MLKDAGIAVPQISMCREIITNSNMYNNIFVGNLVINLQYMYMHIVIM